MNDMTITDRAIRVAAQFEGITKNQMIMLIDVMEAIDVVVDALEEIKRLFNMLADFVHENLLDVFDAILALEPRRRYKLVRKIGEPFLPLFFNRKGIYHCRNNC